MPQQHRDFVAKTLLDLGCRRCPTTRRSEGTLGWLHSIARSHVEVALNHPISLIANALGSPPADVIERCMRQVYRWLRWRLGETRSAACG